MKTSELTGAALDWAVAKIEGREFEDPDSFLAYYDEGGMRYSTDWAQGGPIIDREKIKLGWIVNHWGAQKDFNYNKSFYGRDPQHSLTAAMRCYVSSKLGDDIQIPKELTK